MQDVAQWIVDAMYPIFALISLCTLLLLAYWAIGKDKFQ